MLSHTSTLILPLSSRDVFNMESIYLPKLFVNCNFHTHRDVTLDMSPTPPSLSTSAAAFIASSLEKLYLLYNKCQDIFPIIFDTGASLAVHFLIKMTLWVVSDPLLIIDLEVLPIG